MTTAADRGINAVTRGLSLVSPPLPENEAARLAALYEYKILGTVSEKPFDEITRLAAYICGTPIALVSLVDANRQWFKSKLGLEVTETLRDVAFCAYTILQADVLIVPDALTDERFATNPLVTSEPYIRFYAGVPLITPEGYALGSLCVIDYIPRELTPEQLEALQTLSRQVVRQIELRRNLAELQLTAIERKPLPQKQRQRCWKRIVAGFGLTSAMLVVMGLTSYKSTSELIKTSQQVVHTQKVLEKLAGVFSQIKDAEAGQRGYILTGKERYLEPYQAALAEVEGELEDLQQLTADNPQQQRQIATLETLTAKKIAELQDTIQLRRDKGFEAALQVVQSDRGKDLMDKIHQAVRQMQAEENVLLEQQSLLAQASDRTTIFTFFSGIFLNFGIFAALYYFIYRENSDRQRTEVVLEQERNFTAAVLDTAGALVVVFDLQGRIVRFNLACEQLTGYSFAEVKDKYFWDLFLIPEEVEQVKATFKKLQAGQFPNEYENYWVTRDGDRRLLTWSNTALCDKEGAVEYIISTGIDITERKRADEQVNLLQTLMLAIGECQDFESALAVVLRTVCETQGWNYGEAWIPCPKESVLICSPAWYSNADDLESGIKKFRKFSEELTFGLGSGLPGRVWSSQQPEWQEDVSREPEQNFLRTQIVWDCRLQAGMGIPLLVNEQLLAVLVFFKFESGNEDKRLIESISALATQLGSIMQRKRMEQILRESEERFKVFMNNSPAVAFMKDEQGRYVYVNEPFERRFNLKLTDWLGKTDFDLWSEQIALRSREDDTHVLTADKTIETLETVPNPDGCPRDWLTLKFPFKDVFGQRFVGGVAVDITERQQAEALQQANEKLADWVNELEQRNSEIALLSQMSGVLQTCLTVEEAYTALHQLVQPLFPQTQGGIFLISSSKNLVEAVATWGSPPLPSQEIFAPHDCWALRRGRVHMVTNTIEDLGCKHLHPGSLAAESLCVPMIAQGEALGVLYLSSPESGRLTQTKQQLAVTVAENISLALANLKLRQTLQNQSIRDPLTGLFNRRYLEESLEREVNRCQRQEKSLGIIMLDVDHFKRFNDTFGHEAGDIVLRELGLFLQSHIRGSDIACRYGGEEFMLILPETSLEVIKQRAEQLRQGVKHLQVQDRRQSLGAISLSLGVACFPAQGMTGEAVIRAADAALYRAKALGRDRVMTAS